MPKMLILGSYDLSSNSNNSASFERGTNTSAPSYSKNFTPVVNRLVHVGPIAADADLHVIVWNIDASNPLKLSEVASRINDLKKACDKQNIQMPKVVIYATNTAKNPNITFDEGVNPEIICTKTSGNQKIFNDILNKIPADVHLRERLIKLLTEAIPTDEALGAAEKKCSKRIHKMIDELKDGKNIAEIFKESRLFKNKTLEAQLDEGKQALMDNDLKKVGAKMDAHLNNKERLPERVKSEHRAIMRKLTDFTLQIGRVKDINEKLEVAFNAARPDRSKSTHKFNN